MDGSWQGRKNKKLEKKSNLKTSWKKSAHRETTRIYFTVFIESVFPDMDTAYPLHTIRRIAYLDVIQSLFLCIFKNIIVSSVYTAYSLYEYDVLLDWLVFRIFVQTSIRRIQVYLIWRIDPGQLRIYLFFESNQYRDRIAFCFLISYTGPFWSNDKSG